ncbi:hypothetical protein BH20ACT10_BH20ACT10_11530 [soil metagenome]
MSGKLKDWEDLESSLPGAFSARAKGFLGSEFPLSGPDGDEFGVLRLEGSGASFEAGGTEGRIESSASKHRMFIGGEEVLTAGRDGSGGSGMSIESGGDSLEAVVSPVRNSASARSGEGRELVRVSGGVSNRRYEVSFEGGGLAVAVFLLYHVVSVRRRAFRAGTAAGKVK